ncbi:hypothetical protein D9C01_13630, partial [Corynebacterium diphtheriae]
PFVNQALWDFWIPAYYVLLAVGVVQAVWVLIRRGCAARPADLVPVRRSPQRRRPVRQPGAVGLLDPRLLRAPRRRRRAGRVGADPA